MQRKIAFLICAMTAMISFNHAFAVSIEDSGKFEIKSASGDYKIGIGGLFTPMVQLNHEKISANDSRWDLNWMLKRARLRLYGNAYDPALTYLLQLQFENDLINENSNRGSAKLMDASVSWAINQTWFHLAVGKFAVPGSRQQVISSAKSQFLQSSSLLKVFDAVDPYGRDVGLLAHNAWDHQLEYALAVVSNGLAARVGYNHGHLDGYDAVDFAGGDLRCGVGASGFFRSDYMKEIGKTILGSADYMVKYKHFSSNGAFYFKRENEQNWLGVGADAGYLINGKWEPMLRYNWLNQAQVHGHEVMAGLSHYWYGHNVKSQLYFGMDFSKGYNKGFGGLGIQLAL
ncbi:MAG TPA: hypothetical protein VEK06_01575 [Myxococcota bacterium]|nr:hypothetical protein [Myxococcota bacterium]